MSVVAERSGFRATAGECGAVILLYAFLGPLLGLVVFSVGMAVLAREPGIALLVMLFGWIFAHVMGVISALAAGGAAICLHLLVRGVPLWIGPASGLVGLALAIASSIAVGRVPREARAWDIAVLLIVVHLLSAILMWLLARMVLRPSQGDAALGVKKEIV